MELKDYLQKSKERRENIMKTANKYLNKTSSGEIIYKTKKPGLIDDNAFYGPTPKGLKSFEEEVNQQLKKYFKPEAPDTGKSQNKIFRNIGVNKGIQKAYSKNSGIIKKKPLIMLPKSIFLSPLRIIKQVTDGKYMQNSPYRAQIKKHSSKRNLTPIKNYDRNALLIPVLNKSTVGHKSTLSVN